MAREPSAKISDDAIVIDDENPEWTDEDFARAKGLESLPANILAQFPNTRIRGPQKAPTKRPVSIRLSQEVVEHFRATGPGWQGRIDETLKAAIKADGGR
jgi:uncharacterized protein (DUF4415 family)